ncbi:7247_t:CDS:1, partial [Gigaspora rosea]
FVVLDLVEVGLFVVFKSSGELGLEFVFEFVVLDLVEVGLFVVFKSSGEADLEFVLDIIEVDLFAVFENSGEAGLEFVLKFVFDIIDVGRLAADDEEREDAFLVTSGVEFSYTVKRLDEGRLVISGVVGREGC